MTNQNDFDVFHPEELFVVNPEAPRKDYSEILLTLVNSAYFATDSLVEHYEINGGEFELTPQSIHNGLVSIRTNLAQMHEILEYKSQQVCNKPEKEVNGE